jgi:cell division protein ZapA (FtsZ GTPase activity inhibitor)
MDLEDTREFELMGHRFRFKAESSNDIEVNEVIDLVNKEVEKVQTLSPNVAPEKLAVLVALRIAADRLSVEKEFRGKIKEIQSFAVDALTLIEESVPQQ